MSTLWYGDRQIDSSTVDRRAAQAATGFESLGVRPGDGVGIYLRNDIPFFEAALGAGSIGAYAVAMNWHYTAEEAQYLFEDSGVKVVVIHADLLRPVRAVIPAGVTVLVVPVPPEIREAYTLSDADCALPDDLPEWNQWRDGFAPRTAPPGEMPSNIIYTSGTTGKPKGVRRPTFTPEQAAAFGTVLSRSYGYDGWLDHPQDIVTAVVGPIYHSAPNAHALFSYRSGANLVVCPRFDQEELLQLVDRHKITHMNMVPIMFNRLLRLPEATKQRYSLSSLRYIAHAAAPCSPPVKREMIAWWGPVINEYYGSTEMGNVTICNSEEWLAHPGTVGRVAPGAQIRIVDAEGRDLPRGQIGEVLGRITAIGDFTYHGDDAKRRKAEKNGLFTPGDVGYFDEDGFLYLCDRANDMVISGGVNIYPAEIEAQLHKMDGVADCAIFGIPDEDFGEVVCAVVQTQPGVSLTDAEVKAYLRQHVAGYKVPRRVEFQDDLPREDSGKIFKRKLRAPFWENAGRSI